MNRQLFEYSYELKKQTKRRIFFTIFNILFIYFFLNVLFAYILFPVKQVSNSMIPDFPENSISFVTPLCGNLERGDVVLLKTKVQENHRFYEKIWHNISMFFSAQQYDSYTNKKYPDTICQMRRIVALPGDEIYMRDYVLYVKPKGEKHFLTEFELTVKPYNLTFVTPPEGWNGSVGVKGSFDSIFLGDDEYFVLGDNRISISDSRLWGVMDRQNIKGRVVVRYFPFNSFKLY
ncbi:MAG: signal peptidase I [Treponema sp.]|nr:signal peptidase I [Treponema sp.]